MIKYAMDYWRKKIILSAAEFDYNIPGFFPSTVKEGIQT